MSEAQIAEILLELAALFALAYLLAGLLVRVRIPGILAALFVSMAAHYTPLGDRLLSPELYPSLSLLAELGVLFLLFFIGLQINMQEMRRLSRDIIWCGVLNTGVAFVLGTLVMLSLGYGWVLALVVGLTTMPTAEAVIVPILDELELIHSRVGQFIVGTGVIDDVVEVFMVALVSVWIGRKAATAPGASVVIGEPIGILMIAVSLLVGAYVAYRWALPWLGHWLPRRPRNLMLLTVLVLFGFGGLSQLGSLGSVVGAVTAGILMRPMFDRMGAVGEQVEGSIRSLSYGFVGPIFFMWVGLSADLEAMLQAPTLAILLFLAAFVGKLIGVFLMVPMNKLSVTEAWTIGIGLNARLTTEIIVAKLLLGAGLIDLHLFTALVASASASTIAVPLLFSFLVRRWGDKLRQPIEISRPREQTERA